MSTITETPVAPSTQAAPAAPAVPATFGAGIVNLSEKAAKEVKRIVSEQGTEGAEKIYLRLRVVGGGCSGFQNKLDLDPIVNAKLDEVSEQHGVPIVVDKRSMMYLQNVTVDFHDDLNRRGFSISNPTAKGTCGCGSSSSM